MTQQPSPRPKPPTRYRTRLGRGTAWKLHTVRLDPEASQALERTAARLNTSRNEVVRMAILDFDVATEGHGRD